MKEVLEKFQDNNNYSRENYDNNNYTFFKNIINNNNKYN